MELVSVENKAIGSPAASPTLPQQRSLQSSGSCSSEASEAAAVARRRSAASDQEEVLLRLLLVSGNRSDFPCPLDWSVSQLKQNVIKNWPKEWQCEERTDRTERLRILYQGRFLEDGILLKNLALPKEHFVTMHLIMRPQVPDQEGRNFAKISRKPSTRTSESGVIRLLNMSAANSVETLPPRDATLFKSTLKFYENKQYKRGLKACEQLLKKHPGHGESLAMKGLFLANLNRKEEGYEHVRLALKTCLRSHVCWHVYGLLYRADKNYEEAMKCYRNALRFDKDNFQILRDLAVLQLQLRQYPALCESRYQLLSLRSVVKINWISLSIAYHLSGKRDLAVGVLDAILDGFPEEPGNRFFDLEQAELVSYKTMILEELGQTEAALKCLDDIPERRRHQMAFLVKRAKLLEKLGHIRESKELWLVLFEFNPDDREALAGVLRSTEANSVYSTLNELYAKYPKSLLLAEELIINSPMEHFGDTLRLIALPAIKKGALGLLKPLKRFYFDPVRCRVLREFFDSLQTVVLDQPSRSWALIALANHLSLSNQHAEAVEVMEGLVRESSNAPDVLMHYARTLKRSGDLDKAAWAMNEARQMDLSDRFLNSKAVKYYLRGGMISEAQNLAVMFVKKGDLNTQLQDLVDMQVLWYALELANAYQRKDEHDLALKYYRQVVNHFRDFIDDQFDFHNYVLRRYTFESYIKLLSYEDVLLGHELYKAAILAACRSAHALVGNAPKPIEERLTKASLDASPLQEVSTWLDGILKFRRYDDTLLSTAAEVYATLGMTVRALKCLFHCSLAGKINHDAILKGIPAALTDGIDRDVLVSVQPRLP